MWYKKGGLLTHIGFRPFFHAMVTNDTYVAIGLYLYFLISGVALPIRWQAAGCIKTGTQDLLDQNLLSFFYPTSKRVATWGSLPPGVGLYSGSCVTRITCTWEYTSLIWLGGMLTCAWDRTSWMYSGNVQGPLAVHWTVPPF